MKVGGDVTIGQVPQIEAAGTPAASSPHRGDAQPPILPTPQEEWRSHWRVVVAGAAGTAITSTSTYLSGVMIRPLEQEFGWTRAAIASGPMIPAIMAVLLAPIIGMAIDRFGPRRIGLWGIALTCIGLAALGTTGPSIWHWRALWILMGVAVVLVKPAVWSAGVASLFSTSRGLALAVALSGTAITGFVTPPLAYLLVEGFGWRGAYGLLGALWFVIAFPIVFALFTSAHDQRRLKWSTAPAATPVVNERKPKIWAVIRTRNYLALLLAAVCMVLATTTFVINIVPILIAKTIEPASAAALASIIGVTTVVARLGGGHLLDRMNAGVVAASACMLPIFSSILLLGYPGSLFATVLAVVFLGLAIGAELDAVAYLVARHFGMENFGLLYATIGGFQALSAGLGPMAVGHIFDVTGSYDLALQMFIPIAALGSLLCLAMKETIIPA